MGGLGLDGGASIQDERFDGRAAPHETLCHSVYSEVSPAIGNETPDCLISGEMTGAVPI